MKKIIDFIKSGDRKKIIVILLLVVVVIIALVIFFRKNNTFFANTSEGDIFREEYESLNNQMSIDDKKYPKVDIDIDNIKYISIDETLDMLTVGSGTKGTGAIYIGYAECIYCRSAIQVLVDTAEKSEIDNIYYLDISKVWDEREININGEVVIKQDPHERYYELVNRLGNDYTKEYVLFDKNGKEVSMNSRRVEAPLVIFVVGGQIVSSNVGTIVSQEDPYEPLNKEQVDFLSETYGYGLRDVIDGLEYHKLLEKEQQKQVAYNK